MRLSRRHPRFRSLLVRVRLARAHERGVVVPEGLIAHGRGEAFDYLIGERSPPAARRAEKTAAEWLLAAERPVVSVNGNVAALAARELALLRRAIPHLAIEINLFHRTGVRARRIADLLRRAGVRTVLGIRPTARIPGLPSDRALVDRRGIYRADVCLIPLEDGDRAEALRARGQRVISIDLNPLSRTSRSADVPIVDELTRALSEIARRARQLRRAGRRPVVRAFDANRARAESVRAISRHLRRADARTRPSRPRSGASARRSRGTRGR
jgi:4-phosphopantoate--beta-alanine ligase